MQLGGVRAFVGAHGFCAVADLVHAEPMGGGHGQAAGGALMWVAKPVVQELMVEDGAEVVVEMNDIEGEHPQTFDEAWEEFTNVTQGFVEDVMDAEAEAALLTEASEEDGSQLNRRADFREVFNGARTIDHA